MEIIKDESQYNMVDWWKKVFIENYANFEGRARRSEYWYYVLFNFIIVFGTMILGGLLALIIHPATFFIFYILLVLASIANFIPNLAVIVRRLHDTGKSGWYYLIGIIPLVGPILLLVALATEGDRGTNEYGSDPKTSSNPTSNQSW